MVPLNGKPKKFGEQITYLGSNITSTDSDVNIQISKACCAIDWFPAIRKSDL